MQNLIFALDIGTRSVVGLILIKKDEGYHVVDVFSAEHKERSMLDGQIHNVPAVAERITYVKKHLEEKHGPLSSVCVAAAGRSLKTKRAAAEQNIAGRPIFDRQSLLHLELSAVQKAQFELASEDTLPGAKVNDYCVGYSVISYKLDEEPIGSLLDQRGETASVEVIATFLPKVVVESLISALQRSGLELEALTLEPIAAINVLIPQSMRRLNVALADIGAGTSDIAITDYGTVTAYGMVPVAGDEITEALSDQFLLDFPEAEKTKRKLSEQDTVTFTDILGMEQELSKEDVTLAVDQAVSHLADRIAAEIIHLNGRSPKAVMLVGGGSMTPGLPGKLAERLELPESRVAIRGIDAIQNLTFEEEYEATPELVTPIGISIAAKESPVEYISIQVNDETVRLFDIKRLTVGDGLLSSGLELSRLYGKPGMGIMVKVNGKVLSFPGEHGTPPVLKKNGENTELDAPIEHGDMLIAEKGTNGHDACITAGDVLDEPSGMSIQYNGSKVDFENMITVNGERVSHECELNDRDTVESRLPLTISEVLETLGTDVSASSRQSVSVTVNDEPVIIPITPPRILLNGEEAPVTASIRDGDSLEVNENHEDRQVLRHAVPHIQDQHNKEIIVTFNGEPVRLEKELFDCYINGLKAPLSSRLQNGDNIKFVRKESETFIFQDVFSKVKIQRPENGKKKPVILRNDEETSFSADIRHGDVLQLKWVDLG